MAERPFPVVTWTLDGVQATGGRGPAMTDVVTTTSNTAVSTTRRQLIRISLPPSAKRDTQTHLKIGETVLRRNRELGVATSNVIVEVDDSDPIRCGEHLLGRVLVTHLHSYATPILRYDLGDFACYKHKCDCGHDGPVLSHIYGKSKSLLKHQDGRVTPFNIRDNEITAIVDCSEYRIRQSGLRRLVVELATEASLSPEQVDALTRLLRMHADDDLDVEISTCKRIDWGASRKRLGFLSEVL
jgi:phenylacetate-coenzyme A ligase PaaK-like adenylate-forming protein